MPQVFPPASFGRYRVLGPLGSGGMAQVFRGYDPVLDREVAIKVISRGSHDAAFNERFRREARVIAMLRHPNIVQVYDYGEHDDSHYMVMEFVHGTDLGRYIASLRSQHKLMSPPQVQSIIDQVAAGLDYAHARRVVHRDVKPSNILLGDDGAVVLTDFGLVLKYDSGVEPTQGQSFGTPEYIAPEQAMDGAMATPRSDIYSLGVVLYLMLTNSLPFQAETPLKTVLKHISDAPPRPRRLNPTLPPAVESVVLKAMSKEPEKRYATAGELARALRVAWSEQLAEASAEVTQSILPRSQARRPAVIVPRRRSLAGLAGGMALAAIVIGLVALLVGLLKTDLTRIVLPIVAPPVRAPSVAPTGMTIHTPTVPATAVLAPMPAATETPSPTQTATATCTPEPSATATAAPTATPSATVTTAAPTSTPTPTASPRPTAAYVPFYPTWTATPTPTQPPWIGPLTLVEFYVVEKQCVQHKPIRMWNVWIKMRAEGGNGIYVYYIDDRPVSGPTMGEFIYVLQVTDGSQYKAPWGNVESAGIFTKNPLQIWIEAPDGC